MLKIETHIYIMPRRTGHHLYATFLPSIIALPDEYLAVVWTPRIDNCLECYPVIVGYRILGLVTVPDEKPAFYSLRRVVGFDIFDHLVGNAELISATVGEFEASSSRMRKNVILWAITQRLSMLA